MGLKIKSFKNKGNTFVDAYAKVENFNLPNDVTKIATFNIKVYDTKDSTNLIMMYPTSHIKINTNENSIPQCYAYTQSIIDSKKEQIAKLTALSTVPALPENKKLSYLSMIEQIKSDDILQLDGAEIWQ